MAVGGRKHQQRNNQKPESVRIDIQVVKANSGINYSLARHEQLHKQKTEVETEYNSQTQTFSTAGKQLTCAVINKGGKRECSVKNRPQKKTAERLKTTRNATVDHKSLY